VFDVRPFLLLIQHHLIRTFMSGCRFVRFVMAFYFTAQEKTEIFKVTCSENCLRVAVTNTNPIE
jgi:hypothetical protein